MVDFNNESTIGRPALDIVRVLVLEKREDCFRALQGFNTQKFLSADPPDVHLRSRVSILYEELRSSIKRTKPEDIEALEKKIFKGNISELIEALRFINTWLDDIRLTRLDIRRDYDRRDAEFSNQMMESEQ